MIRRPRQLILLCGALAAAACATRGVLQPGAAADVARGASEKGVAAPALEAARAGPAVRWTIDISAASNLFHWVDNLAETSAGKNKATYYSDWVTRFGPLSQDDHRALDRFREVRLKLDPPRTPAILTAPGATQCLPAEDPGLGRSQRLMAAALDARDLDDLTTRAAAVVGQNDAAELRAALDQFSGRFQKVLWPATDYLQPFQTEFEAFLAEADTVQLMQRFAHFFNVTPDPAAPSRISLIAVLRDDVGTHAEADGTRLLLEIRPTDRPRQQLPVIFHELAHDLLRRRSREQNTALAARYLSQGPAGALAWSYFNEALATALGQGLAQALLAPAAFRPDAPWYHLPQISRMAQEIYPLVREELLAGRTIDDALPERIVARMETSTLSGRVRLIDSLGSAAAVGTNDVIDVIASLPRASHVRMFSPVDLDGPVGAPFVRQFTCVPIIGLTTAANWPRVGTLIPDATEIPAGALPIPEDAAGIVVPIRRTSGAAALWMIASTPADARVLVDAVIQLNAWPRQMYSVRRPRRR